MLSEASSNSKDPWETPPIELDSELVETSQRLMSISEAIYSDGIHSTKADAKDQPSDHHRVALETRNKFLFNRNIELVAKVAALETANLRLQAQVSELKESQRNSSPWYLRWL
jgi:hypothetical protein